MVPASLPECSGIPVSRKKILTETLLGTPPILHRRGSPIKEIPRQAEPDFLVPFTAVRSLCRIYGTFLTPRNFLISASITIVEKTI
jgi:hypothetical protein